MHDWSWLGQVVAGMFAGLSVALGAWRAAVQCDAARDARAARVVTGEPRRTERTAPTPTG
jgi:hypothetical protein